LKINSLFKFKIKFTYNIFMVISTLKNTTILEQFATLTSRLQTAAKPGVTPGYNHLRG
jgi:hypothetical protein